MSPDGISISGNVQRIPLVFHPSYLDSVTVQPIQTLSDSQTPNHLLFLMRKWDCRNAALDEFSLTWNF